MKKVLIIVAVVLVVVALVPLAFPGSYHVQRSVMINADKALVYDKVVDFKEWPAWSPWMVLEPSAKLHYNGISKKVGSQYDWSGDLIGAGEMEIVSIEGTKRIDYDLRFTSPWESESKVYMELKEKNGGVEVLWGMTGSNPYFLRFMNAMMDEWIGMDYVRGLSMLKDLCEQGAVHSKITYGEVKEFDGVDFIGLRHKVKMDEMGTVMAPDFAALKQLFEDKGLKMEKTPLTIYYNMDFKTGMTEFATAFIVEGADDVVLPEKFFKGKLPHTKVFTVKHVGDYKHVGNAWKAAVQYTRTKKMKPKLKDAMWEFYTNDPRLVESPADYETVVYIQVK